MARGIDRMSIPPRSAAPLPDVAIPEFIGVVEHSDPTKASDVPRMILSLPTPDEVHALPTWATVTLILGTYAFILGLAWIIWGAA